MPPKAVSSAANSIRWARPPYGIVLQQPKCCKFAPERRRQLCRTTSPCDCIQRCIFRIKISPPLERLFQSAVHRHQHRIKHQHGAFGTIVPFPIDDIHNTLTCRDDPVDHPVERPSIQQLLSPPREVSRAMPRRRICLLPAPHIINALTTHREFDKMHSQEKSPDKIKVFCFFSSEKKSLASWNV